MDVTGVTYVMDVTGVTYLMDVTGVTYLMDVTVVTYLSLLGRGRVAAHILAHIRRGPGIYVQVCAGGGLSGGGGRCFENHRPVGSRQTAFRNNDQDYRIHES